MSSYWTVSCLPTELLANLSQLIYDINLCPPDKLILEQMDINLYLFVVQMDKTIVSPYLIKWT